MAYRQLRERQTETIEPPEDTFSPEEMTAYIRQSTTRQTIENLESMDLQLTGAQKYAVRHGLDKDKIVVAHEGDGKRGVSGTLRIDERERLQEVVAAILAGKTKRLWAYSVSRLFRDEYGSQVGTFIEVCAKHKVKVHIENTGTTFDFSNSRHVMMFQMLATVAAKENADRAKLLHDANNNKAMRGEYNGRPLVPGFIVDRDKKSPTLGKFIEYPLHSKVTAKLYRRYRELGAFNLIAREVALMPVVFPPFDTSVDTRDLHKFRFLKVCAVHGRDSTTRIKDSTGIWRHVHTGCELKGANCKLAGYHISSVGLFKLLTAVEVIGYWKHDGQLLRDSDGEPLLNHAAIVDYDDWQHAFSRLSPVNLDGTENKNRIPTRNTWTAATSRGKDRESTALLQGIITSPLGTVQCNGGKYKVTEQREGMPSRSITLHIGTCTVDQFFVARLEQRSIETDLTDDLWNELVGVRAKNQKALVSVDEQIARYEQSIEGTQAVLKALGKGVDKETAILYNQSIIDDRANLQALIAKKNAANVEETQLTELVDRIQEFMDCGFKSDEHTRRFIRLACEKIELNEYSAHWATLTVTWAAPFHQVDVGYIYLPNGAHEAWGKADELDLRMLYPLTDRAEIVKRFPAKSWASIVKKASDLGITRDTYANGSGIKDRRVSLRDVEVMSKLGVNPRDGWQEAGAWDIAINDASEIPS